MKITLSEPVLLVHHAANRGGHTPANSLKGLRECLEAKASIIEMDISPLADGEFALLHDFRLQGSTDGKGYVTKFTSEQIKQLRHTMHNKVTNENVGVLSQAIDLIRNNTNLLELQLDLKIYKPLDNLILDNLFQIIKPVKEKIRVSSSADWSLRYLHKLDPELKIGFDPILYLDINTGDNVQWAPPFRIGSYGYRDDHPLSFLRWGDINKYLKARAEALFAQVSFKALWFIRGSLLINALDNGFNWIEYLHARGMQIGAWTLDADQPDQIEMARRLITAKIDRITTNDASHLAKALKAKVKF